MSSSEEEAPDVHHSKRRRSSSTGRSESHSRTKSERRRRHVHHKHHRHGLADDHHHHRHKHDRKKYHRRHGHESRSTHKSKSSLMSVKIRSPSIPPEEEKASDVKKYRFSRVGELRPNDIPEDLDFSDADRDSFPLSKETSLFVDAVFPDAYVQVGNRSGARNNIAGGDGESVTKCTYTVSEEGQDVDRKEKIVIELKRSATTKPKKQSTEGSNAKEAVARGNTGIGAWIVTPRRDTSKPEHNEGHSGSSQTKTISKERHSSSKKQKQSRSRSHDHRKSSASVIQTGGKTVDEYTKLCEDIISGNYKTSTVNEPVQNPYSVFDAPDMSEIMKQIRHRVGLELGISSTLDEVFPVSCGYDHRAHEGIDLTKTGITSSVPAELGHLVISRFQAEMRLMGNPNNMEARQILWQVEQKLKDWHRSHKGRHYTGQKINLLSTEELSSGKQAWARPDMLTNLTPVKSDFGEKMMSKMGWRQGEGLGKTNPGNVDPLVVRVKTDRRGLATDDEQIIKKAKIPIIHEVGGKHPVSVLMELCAQKKLCPPDFETMLDSGPSHKKIFKYKIKVAGHEFEAPTVSCSKKQAKALAAMAALEGLGVIKPQGQPVQTSDSNST